MICLRQAISSCKPTLAAQLHVELLVLQHLSSGTHKYSTSQTSLPEVSGFSYEPSPREHQNEQPNQPAKEPKKIVFLGTPTVTRMAATYE